MGGCLSSCPDDDSRSLHSSNHPRSMLSRQHHDDKEAPIRTIEGRLYHDEHDSRYMLPRDEQESDRLHEQHFVTKELLGCNVLPEAFQHLNFQRGGLTILDVCCGPATWLCETSLEYNNSQFTGVDMSDVWPKDIRPVNLQFRRANVLHGIPFPDQSFDFIQMRFVVLAFTADEWRKVFNELRRVLKPGGCLQCIDLDMRVSLQDASVPRHHIDSFEQFYSMQGLDISAGAKLDMRLSDLGFQIQQSEYREIPLGWGGPIGTASLNLFMGKIIGLAPWFKRALDLSDDSFRHVQEETRQHLIQSRAYMGLHAFLAIKPLE
ncbi:S-adenosyl-L-methionine-dependent methyltransferase [Phascolomyces articulosus]|uniref:S-adenosyl-L-methionine-dependent methyltransferase n=1 Tax=Phascolomyces articulosus TaxID=60185 RepID=A0AAD5K214_9FUNG|nr:S-adenosyl-L-methionine-dependent methyltransferase [Phascolomyces articulosus]